MDNYPIFHSVDNGGFLIAEKEPGSYYLLRPGGSWKYVGGWALRKIMDGEADAVNRNIAESIAGTLGGDLDHIAE